jgi:hypothetical protein
MPTTQLRPSLIEIFCIIHLPKDIERYFDEWESLVCWQLKSRAQWTCVKLQRAALNPFTMLSYLLAWHCQVFQRRAQTCIAACHSTLIAAKEVC